MSQGFAKLRFVLWGTAFGAVLSLSQASDPEMIAKMFSGRDLHLLYVIGGAVAFGAIAYRLVAALRRRRGLADGLGQATPLSLRGLQGAAIFGLGWGLTGTCPGTGFVQLGEGKLWAIFTVLGMFAGTLLQARGAAPRSSSFLFPFAEALRAFSPLRSAPRAQPRQRSSLSPDAPLQRGRPELSFYKAELNRPQLAAEEP